MATPSNQTVNGMRQPWLLALVEHHPEGEVAARDQQQRRAETGDVLVDPEGDHEDAEQQPGHDAGAGGGGKSQHRRTGVVSDHEADEGAGIHRPLDAEVEDAGALDE